LCVLLIPLSFSVIILYPPLPTLFPYTTLFRSLIPGVSSFPHLIMYPSVRFPDNRHTVPDIWIPVPSFQGWTARFPPLSGSGVLRSEEHTSALQSRFDLVCRLLLDKKNTNSALD